MIINKEGMRYTYSGTTYTIGAAVVATEASEYQGLCGIITEIRDSVDRETENDTPDIYRCPAVSPSKLSRHERKCGRYPHFQGVRSSL